MEDRLFCQSCSMPLEDTEDFGTEKDGAQSRDYCHYCYVNGTFTKEETMEEMIESCVPFMAGGDAPYKTDDEARKAMYEFFPQLKRWRNN